MILVKDGITLEVADFAASSLIRNGYKEVKAEEVKEVKAIEKPVEDEVVEEQPKKRGRKPKAE